MFDPESFVVGGVSLIVMVFGLVEFFKDLFNMEGKRVTIMAALMGAIVMVLYQLIQVVPAPYEQVVQIVFMSISFGLSASGYYKFAAKRMPSAKE